MYGDDILVLVLVVVAGTIVVAARSMDVLGRLLEHQPDRRWQLPRMRRRYLGDPLAVIHRADPAFTWPAFCARALAVYDAVQQARMVRQPTMAREVVTSELLQGLKNASQYQDGEQPARSLAPIKVTGIGPVSVGLRGERRVLTVRIVAETSAASRDAILGGSGMPWDERYAFATVEVDELWSFERALTAQTAPPNDVDRCPHCGAPVRDPYSGICGYCRHALRQSTDDWRASRIEPTPAMAGVAS